MWYCPGNYGGGHRGLAIEAEVRADGAKRVAVACCAGGGGAIVGGADALENIFNSGALWDLRRASVIRAA